MKTAMKTMKVMKAKRVKNKDDETDTVDEQSIADMVVAKDEAIESWPSERIVKEPSKFATCYKFCTHIYIYIYIYI